MFAIIMWIDMALFAILAWRYKSIPIKSDEDYERERLEEDEKQLNLNSGLEKVPVHLGGDTVVPAASSEDNEKSAL